eukprot:Nk52_evm30s153 gene=Nk52_evmTU30s153
MSNILPTTHAEAALSSFAGANDVNSKQEITITLTDVSYDLDVIVSNPGLVQRLVRGEKKVVKNVQILKGITATIRPGQMTALMGPSGAGKSTLLDVIAGLKNQGNIEGDLLFNGQPRGKDFRHSCGYVEQLDTLLPTLTVREILMYTARLRLPSTTGEEFKVQRVEQIIKELGLTHCADTIIGNQSVRGISGGEAKRCNIAIELVTDPRVLFLDEPTTGLDSSTALEVMKVIRGLTNRGRSVICTIHQPSNDIYRLFDNLMLLVSGEIVYNGNSQMAVDYFKQMGFKKPLKMSDPEFVVSVTDRDDTQRERATLIEGPDVPSSFFAKQYVKSKMFDDRLQSNMKKVTNIDLEEVRRVSAEDDDSKNSRTVFTNSVFYNLLVLTSRASKQHMRDRTFLFARIVRTLIMSFLLSTVFANQSHSWDDQYNIFSVLNFVVMNVSFGSLVFMNSLIVERKFFQRERAAGSYQVSAYFFGMWLSELPWNILQTFLYLIIYFSVGLSPEPQTVFTFLLIVFLLSDLASGFSMFWSSVAKDYQTANIMVMPVLLLSFLFAGFYVRKPEIPDYWVWAYYISFLNYPLNALATNEYSSSDDWTNVNGDPMSADDVLNFWGYGPSGAITSLYGNVGVVALFWIFWRAVPYLGLRYVSHGTR